MTIWRTRFASWVYKAANTHREHVIFIVFYRNNGSTNAPQSYVIRILPVFFGLVCSVETKFPTV